MNLGNPALHSSCPMPLASQPETLPPPVIRLTNVRNRENFPGWVPPSSVSCNTALGHTQHNLLPCYGLCYIVCFVFTVSSPPSLSIDAETTDDTAVYDYVVDEPFPLGKATRQANPPCA